MGTLAGTGIAVGPHVTAGPASTPTGRVVSIVSIAAGAYPGYAVLSDGHVLAWGDDLEGQIGDTGPWSSRPVPVEVDGLAAAILVAGGANSSFALRRDGTVWAWGDDSQGELADEQFTARQTPGLVPKLTDVRDIAAGAFSVYAIRDDGTAWAWGDNSFGQLGTGSDEPVSTVPREIARLTDVVAIAAGTSNGYTLLHDGTVWTWGDDSLKQLGGSGCGSSPTGHRGPCRVSSVPHQVPSLTKVVAIAAGGDSGYALRRDGTVWAWGDNEFGELGNGMRSLDEGSAGSREGPARRRRHRRGLVLGLRPAQERNRVGLGSRQLRPAREREQVGPKHPSAGEGSDRSQATGRWGRHGLRSRTESRYLVVGCQHVGATRQRFGGRPGPPGSRARSSGVLAFREDVAGISFFADESGKSSAILCDASRIADERAVRSKRNSGAYAGLGDISSDLLEEPVGGMP